MKKYNELLLEISRQYNICKGNYESVNDFKTRLIYSICGMMAYASLWDDSEDLVSIVHMKRRIRNTLENYKSIYPELANSLPQNPEELEEEIANQFLRTGVVYHRPNRITPSVKREEPFDGILFQRGIALDNITYVSGIGFYTMQDGKTPPNKVQEMFGLEQENLKTLWAATLSAASWTSYHAYEYSSEYLRLKPPFTRGYWTNTPDTKGNVSILRTGMKGTKLYYLYRSTASAIEVSPLPQWMVENNNYRTLACACLFNYGTLPPIEYSTDGALVHIHMNYLLPPRELEFLKLYSWPEKYTVLPCDFKRKLSTEVFIAIGKILSNEGYEVKEV